MVLTAKIDASGIIAGGLMMGIVVSDGDDDGHGDSGGGCT